MLLHALFGGVVLAVLVGLVLGRHARMAGAVFLLAGTGPMTMLWFYERTATGDTSGFGMGATLAAILFIPFGLILLVIGWFRSD